MPSNPSNPFGDESVNPFGSNLDASIPEVPGNQPRNPPLPVVPGPEPDARPIRLVPKSQLVSPAAPKKARKSGFNWVGLLLWVMIIAASIPVTLFMVKARRDLIRENRELSFKPARARLILSVNQEWQEIGFILRPGDKIVITATGEYSNAHHGLINAEGIQTLRDEKTGLRSYEPLFPHGCLIARTSSKPTEVFYIGSAGLLETGTGGRLQVRINDLDLNENRGSLSIEAKTYLDTPPNGEKLRRMRDSAVTPIKK